MVLEDPPPPLVGGTPIGPITYPTYRLFVIAFAVIVGVILALVQQRTRIGAVLRAGVDDREMVAAMGIDVDRVFAGMFLVGSVLAGTAGMIAESGCAPPGRNSASKSRRGARRIRAAR